MLMLFVRQVRFVPNVNGGRQNTKQIYRDSGLKVPAYNTLLTWQNAGVRLIQLASSGKSSAAMFSLFLSLTSFVASIYILFILATLELRWDALNSLNSHILAVAKALRNPADGRFSSSFYTLLFITGKQMLGA
jgi:hypothetical protein